MTIPFYGNVCVKVMYADYSLLFPFHRVTAKTHSLTSSSEASDTQLEFVNCELNGIKWWKTCFPKG